MIGVIGFVQGIFFLTIVSSVALSLSKAAKGIWKTRIRETHWFDIPLSLSAVLFMVIVFFGFGAMWIDFLAQEPPEVRALTTVWGRSWFAGILVYLACPLLEDLLRRKRKK